jgi:predicted aconitase with swiveling domain
MDGVDVGVAVFLLMAAGSAVHSYWVRRVEATGSRPVVVSAARREAVMAMPASALAAMPVVQEAWQIVVAEERRLRRGGVPRPRRGE